jgi:hypothetical protein
MSRRAAIHGLLGLAAFAWATFAQAALPLVPYPSHVEEGKGNFVLDRQVSIEAPPSCMTPLPNKPASNCPSTPRAKGAASCCDSTRPWPVTRRTGWR